MFSTSKRSSTDRVIIVVAAAGAYAMAIGCEQQAERSAEEPASDAPVETIAKATALEHDIAHMAKVLCSSVFVAGLDAELAMKATYFDFIGHGFSGKASPDDVRTELDRERKRVTISADGVPSRTAAFYGDQGCVVHPRDRDGVYFEPIAVPSTLPPGDSQPWPMGEVLDDASLADDIDQAKLEDAVDAAFGDERAYTAAFVVVHKGRIIAERYGAGADRDTPLVSWSMGKSLTATLLGILMHQGEDLSLDGAVPVPEWRGEGDPRSAITLTHLMRMSSGLAMSNSDEPKETWTNAVPDHSYVYREAIDVFDFAVNRPLAHPPGTVGDYQNSDPLTIGYVIKRAVEARGQNYLTFPQSDLFDKLGIRKIVLEPDVYGNFVMTGFEYGRARDWARLGMLYLNDGVWRGERLLPEGFTDFVSTRAPGWDEPVYGGLFWLNQASQRNLPKDAYWMEGGGEQYTLIVPSLDLVVVRMGHAKGGNYEGDVNYALATLDNALGLLVEAVAP